MLPRIVTRARTITRERTSFPHLPSVSSDFPSATRSNLRRDRDWKFSFPDTCQRQGRFLSSRKKTFCNTDIFYYLCYIVLFLCRINMGDEVNPLSPDVYITSNKIIISLIHIKQIYNHNIYIIIYLCVCSF